MAREARVSLSVYDVNGREVVVLVDGTHRAGRYQVTWDGRGRQGNVRAGIYFVRYHGPGVEIVKRLAMLK